MSMFERTIALLGEEKFNLLKEKTVAIFGLGGVGGTATEALVRSGVHSLIIIDFDNVDISNLNRQILYNQNDIGNPKALVAKKHLNAINPDCQIKVLNLKADDTNVTYLSEYKIDFIIDAIDDVKGKIAIAKFAQENRLPLIISLGMANRLDSTNVEVVRLDKTKDDPLARKIRYEFKNANINTKKVMTVCSKEVPLIKGKILSSMMMVPSSAGLAIASYVIKELTK